MLRDYYGLQPRVLCVVLWKYKSAPALNMDDEKLIECVRKFEFLYNLQHPKYMDTLKKEMAWKEISKQLKQPATACKQKWQGLRDAYRRALNKKKGKSGQAAKNTKKWKYEDEMSFVTSFFLERKTLESVELTSDDEEPSIKDEEIEIQNPNSDIGMNSTDAVEVAGFKNTMDIEIQNEEETIVRNKSLQLQCGQTKETKAMKRAKVLPVQSASAVLMARLLDNQNKCPQREPNELDHFFLNISDTVKKFSPYLQAVAKSKIFSLVSEMELQLLAPPSSTASSLYAFSNVYIPSPASTSSSVQASATPVPTSPVTCKKCFFQNN